METVDAIRNGQIFVDETEMQTSLVLVNPAAQSAIVTLIVRDANAMEVSRNLQVLVPGQHFSRYVRQLFSGLSRGFLGRANASDYCVLAEPIAYLNSASESCRRRVA